MTPEAEPTSTIKPGPLAWMAQNTVAANLLMFILIVGGLIMGTRIQQEVFPELDMGWIRIQVAYPGSTPEEVEKGIILAVEEGVRGIEGVKQVTASAREGFGSVYVEMLLGADGQRVLADVKNAVDRVSSFPEGTERPLVSMMSTRREVISVALHGPLERSSLKELAELFRDQLLQDPDITQVELGGLPSIEISVEIPRDRLRTYGLTLDQVAGSISRTAVQLPGGTVKTAGGELLLRTDERRDAAEEFGDIPVVTSPDGTKVTLAEIADIRDGFADVDERALFDGEASVILQVFRVGDQTPVGVADAVRRRMEDFELSLPPGVGVGVLSDWSEMYRDRMSLLVRNAWLGLLLVLVILGLFLEVRLAFWVTLGIPISFAGALLLMPMQGVSINMISLFAFIVTLGMVVDDAIIVGENIYQYRQKGLPLMEASVKGAREVALPVCFAIVTTMVAFMPMYFVPGFSGKLFKVIPAIVISVLFVSLVESLLILPAHLGHDHALPRKGGARLISGMFGAIALLFSPFLWALERVRGVCSGGLERFITNTYGPALRTILKYRYLSVSCGMVMLLCTLGWIGGGRIGFTFMPKMESDRVVAKVVLPFGAPVERTQAYESLLVAKAKEVFADLGEEDKLSRGIYAKLGSGIRTGGPVPMVRDQPGGHLSTVQVRLVSGAHRDFSATEFAALWREKVGSLPGVDALTFKGTFARGPGSAIHVRLSHRDEDMLQAAAADISLALKDFDGIRDVDGGFSQGKPQLNFRLKPEARSLGLTVTDLGRQVRSAFFGTEALRQQRGRDEVKLYVRLPKAERLSEHDIEELLIRTPSGGEVPLGVAAEVTRGRAETSIGRTDGRRVLDVTADVDEQYTTAEDVLSSLEEDILADLPGRYPGLTWSYSGEVSERQNTMRSLGVGFVLAMIVIFALLAIPFRSYVQPIIVMAAIPFGIVGAVIGHIIMGFTLSVISMMGIVALAGVVVNDSLVLVDAANRARREGLPAFEAIHLAASRRFRPILLTSLTTFFGLLPMIFETSLQARFLIPMAISLGYGVLFATVIILGLVPSFFMIVEDALILMGFAESPDGETPPPGESEDGSAGLPPRNGPGVTPEDGPGLRPEDGAVSLG